MSGRHVQQVMRACVLTGSLTVVARPAEHTLDDFESDVVRWGPGVTADAQHVKSGKQSLRWETTKRSMISLADIPHDWVNVKAIELWMHSERATGSRVIITLPSNPPEARGNYYFHFLTVDWTGWRKLSLDVDRLGRARQPMGLHQIDEIRFHGRGWGQDQPVPGTVLCLDELKLVLYEGQELREAQTRRGGVRTGTLAELGNGEHMLECFARGHASWLSEWEVAGDKSPASPKQSWSWVTFPGESRWRRVYDVEIRGMTHMLLRYRAGKGARVTVGARIDGKAVAPVEARAGSDTFEVMRFPVVGDRLEELAIESSGGGALDVEWIKLREPEHTTVQAWYHLTRGICLTWTRPSWGAESYHVARSRQPGDKPEIVAAHVPKSRRLVFDFPPSGGVWRYAVGPVGGTLGESLQVAIHGTPAPTIWRVPAPIAIDGKLDDWPPLAQRDRFVFAAPNAIAHGDARTEPADCSASVTMLHDGSHLYIAALVTDDVPRFDNARPWEGDCLIVMLASGEAHVGRERRRYDTVTSWPLGKARGFVLEDRDTGYPADAKPSAPGHMASSLHRGGYAIEVVLPLAALRRWGFSEDMQGLLIGLSVYDGDQESGNTQREAVISWNQRTGLYSPSEAAVARWAVEAAPPFGSR